jgi:hypothetical protein
MQSESSSSVGQDKTEGIIRCLIDVSGQEKG